MESLDEKHANIWLTTLLLHVQLDPKPSIGQGCQKAETAVPTLPQEDEKTGKLVKAIFKSI